MLQFSPEAVKSLENYHWPGNVRELKNVVERAVYRSDSTLIAEIVFDPFSSPFPPKPPELHRQAAPAGAGKTSPAFEDLTARPMKEALRELKVRMLEQALDRRIGFKILDTVKLTRIEFFCCHRCPDNHFNNGWC